MQARLDLVRALAFKMSVHPAGHQERLLTKARAGVAAEGGLATRLPLAHAGFAVPSVLADARKATPLKKPTINGIITLSAGIVRLGQSRA